MRAGVEPAGQIVAAGERIRLAREIGENGLRDILGRMVVAVDLPERGGIDQVHMALHEFGEGVLGIRPGKGGEQFGVGRHVFKV